jgi:hypothetical protein
MNNTTHVTVVEMDTLSLALNVLSNVQMARLSMTFKHVRIVQQNVPFALVAIRHFSVSNVT